MALTNIHDKYFRGSYLIRQIALDHVKLLLDKSIADAVIDETFQLENISYLDEKLKETFSDIVYSAKLQNGEGAKITFLFEHKSYLPAFPHLQIGRYIFNILEQHYKQKEDFSVIIPIVVYHDRRPWKYKRLSEYYKSLPNFARPFLPDFEIILTDLSEYSDDFLLKLLSDKLLLNVLLVLKHGREPEYVLANIEKLLQGIAHEEKLEKELVRNLLRMTFVYLRETADIPLDKLKTVFNILPIEFRDMETTLIKRIKSKRPIELIDVEIEVLEKHNRWLLAEAEKKQAEAEKKQAEARSKQAEAEKKRAEARSKQAEAEKKQAEAEKKRAEAEKKRAEARSKQAEIEKKQAETEKKQAEKALKKEEQRVHTTIIQLYMDYDFAVKAIAKIIDRPVEYINNVIEQHNKPKK